MWHKPSTIEENIRTQIAIAIPDFQGEIFCVDCTQSCLNSCVQNSVHLIIQANDVTPDVIEFIVVTSFKTIESRHSIPCSEVVVLQPQSLTNMELSQRFKIRDDLQAGKLDDKILLRKVFTDDDHTFSDTEGLCDVCYPNKDTVPLDWQTLDIEKEWYLDTPIEPASQYLLLIQAVCLLDTWSGS